MNPLKLAKRKLLADYKLQKHARRLQRNPSHPSKFSVRSNGNGRGQVLRDSKLTHDVWIERVFVQRK